MLLGICEGQFALGEGHEDGEEEDLEGLHQALVVLVWLERHALFVVVVVGLISS
jgi:hypothetical protein